MRMAIAIRAVPLILGMLWADAAQAEGLFDFLFGGSGSDQPAASAPAPAARQGQRRSGSRDESGARTKNPARIQAQGRRSGPKAGGDQWAGGASYCVRTCDGYFFPLIRSSRATGQQSCEFLCPTAPVELFQGSSIEQARNAKGERYAALPTAFSFRDKTTQNCSCNDPSRSAEALQQMARTDPTLRSGDVVVEDDGPFVYNGASLVTLGRASFVPAQIRERLRAMLRRKGTEPTDPTPTGETKAVAKQPAPVSKPVEAKGSIEFRTP